MILSHYLSHNIHEVFMMPCKLPYAMLILLHLSVGLSLCFSLPGFMVNLCAVLLAFCKPLFSTHVGGPKLSLISRDYPSSPLCRLDLVNERCLASGSICEWNIHAMGKSTKHLQERSFSM